MQLSEFVLVVEQERPEKKQSDKYIAAVVLGSQGEMQLSEFVVVVEQERLDEMQSDECFPVVELANSGLDLILGYTPAVALPSNLDMNSLHEHCTPVLVPEQRLSPVEPF